jgi:hypothetical protein
VVGNRVGHGGPRTYELLFQLTGRPFVPELIDAEEARDVEAATKKNEVAYFSSA